MGKKIKMKDGVYPNQEFEVYVDIDAVNFSSMKHIHTHSLFHYLNWKDKETKALDIGRQVHEFVFEHEKFLKGHAPFPGQNEIEKYFHLFREQDVEKINDALKNKKNLYFMEDGRGAIAKRIKKHFEKNGQEMVSTLDWYMFESIVRSLKENPITNKLIYDGNPQREMTVVWTDKDTGVQCKGRVDNYNNGWELDLKTSKDARPEKYKWDMKNYMYHVQRAFYGDGLRENGLEHKGGIIAAVEKTYPYYVQPYLFHRNSNVWNEAEMIYKKCLEKIADFNENGSSVVTGYVDPDETNKNREHIVVVNW